MSEPMRFVLFVHSLVSDWNHGNAHFLRGIVRELQRRGHAVATYEPADGWSRANLLAEAGQAALDAFEDRFPDLRPTPYQDGLDLDAALDGADVVLVHEWNDPGLIERIGRHRLRGGRYALLFHDTHHRSISDRAAIANTRLDGFDGVLAFGEAVREVYVREGWARRAWTWHEAADVSVFHPRPLEPAEGDLVWIGNWGDDERTAELFQFLLEPARRLGLRSSAYGVRYPDEARRALARAGMGYCGRLANADVPAAFARHQVTVHVPRRHYVDLLPGVPTIRVFEALACGIPLICSPWHDVEGLFRPGSDFLLAADGEAMTQALRGVLSDPDLALELAASGRESILRHHTCAHRIDQLFNICAALGVQPARLDAEVA
jgi:spore maturation protein CgeB